MRALHDHFWVSNAGESTCAHLGLLCQRRAQQAYARAPNVLFGTPNVAESSAFACFRIKSPFYAPIRSPSRVLGFSERDLPPIFFPLPSSLSLGIVNPLGYQNYFRTPKHGLTTCATRARSCCARVRNPYYVRARLSGRLGLSARCGWVVRRGREHARAVQADIERVEYTRTLHLLLVLEIRLSQWRHQHQPQAVFGGALLRRK